MRLAIACILIVGFLQNTLAQSKVTVDVTKEHQTMVGFGAFGAMKAYWESPPYHTNAFVNYFLNDLGSTIVRTNIFWDLEPSNDNNNPSILDLNRFNYKGNSNLAKQLPYYKALKEAGLKKLIATAWTPPTWMKLLDQNNRIPNQCYNCNNCPKGDPARQVCGGRLNPVYYEEFAEYLVAYVKILKQETGIDLYAINIQNEPFFANPFESNVMLPAEFADVLRVVGKRFRSEGLSTKLFGPEHMAEWSWGVQVDYVNEILNDSDIRSYLDIYAVHSYVDGVAPDYGSAQGWTDLMTNISTNHQLPLWMTETSGYKQNIDDGIKLAAAMYLALKFGNISSWVYWSISGEPGSDQALMANGEPTILYYISKQFFRYIRPGAIRIDVTSGDGGVLPLAFKNPETGEMTLVLINPTTSDKVIAPELTVRPSTFNVYRTSATENTAAVGSYTSGTIALPAMSVTTLVGTGMSGPSLDDIPNYYVRVGEDKTIEVPLANVSDGGGGAVTITAESSNAAIVENASVQYQYPATQGKILVTPNTNATGRTTITVKVKNQNNIPAGQFGFNETTRTFSVEVVDIVTSSEQLLDSQLEVFPNPVKGKLNIRLPRTKKGNLEIVDATGKRVYQFVPDSENESITIDTSVWQKGVYILRYQSGARAISKKLIL